LRDIGARKIRKKRYVSGAAYPETFSGVRRAMNALSRTVLRVMSACALVTSVLALVASVGAAQAVTVSGSLWENQTLPWSSTCQCAVPTNVPTTTPDA
jgi:hypothetical protein